MKFRRVQSAFDPHANKHSCLVGMGCQNCVICWFNSIRQPGSSSLYGRRAKEWGNLCNLADFMRINHRCSRRRSSVDQPSRATAELLYGDGVPIKRKEKRLPRTSRYSLLPFSVKWKLLSTKQYYSLSAWQSFPESSKKQSTRAGGAIIEDSRASLSCQNWKQR